MENKLISQLRTLVSSRGLSITAMDTTIAKSPYENVEELLWKLFFLKSDGEILSETIAMKKAEYKTLYEIDFCPFESLTKVSWEEMFDAAILRREEFKNDGMKVILPWLHITIGSIYYSLPHAIKSKHAFAFKLEHTGDEYVKIDNVIYAYGESKIIAWRIPSTRNATSLPIWLVQPTIVFDERLIPSLAAQPEWPKVLEILYILYHMSSHDGLLHSVFMEGDMKIRPLAANDPVMKQLPEVLYHCFDMFEVNYSRMMRAVFDLMCVANPTLRENTLALLSEVRSLSKDWPTILKQYVDFIATERISRLIQLSPSQLSAKRYIGGVKRDGVKQPIREITDEYLYQIIHISPEKGALVHDGFRSNVEEIPFETMAKFFFNHY